MPLEEKLDEARTEVEKALRTAMIQRGYKQSELAKMFGVSRGTMSRAINGDGNQQSKKIREKLYKLLDITGK